MTERIKCKHRKEKRMKYIDWLRPVIGAGIGYITNWIAVKMMFRPIKEYKIGKFRIPFTPGIIPKNKERISAAIAQVVSENLLNEETLKKQLLSDDVKQRVRNHVVDVLNGITENEQIVEEAICQYVEREKFIADLNKFNDNISESIFNTVKEANLGELIQEKINEETNEKFKGSILGMLGGKAISDTIAREIKDKVNIYIDENGKELIRKMVNDEVEKYTKATIGDVATKIGMSDFDLVEFIMNLYEKLIISKINEVLVTINISDIIKSRIDEMDMVELEGLILMIMKKELNALVSLGAIIGFVLGLVNLLF